VQALVVTPGEPHSVRVAEHPVEAADGAVLVRPDGHIAWRVEAGSVTDHVVALGDAVARATARLAGIAGGREVAMAA